MRRGVIRIGDPLSSGGQVVSACSLFKVDGKEVAGVGDACHCNRHGDVKIVEGIETFTFFGKKLALHGCKASCGCSIISTTELMVVDTGGGSAAQEGQPEPPRAAEAEMKHALTLTEKEAQTETIVAPNQGESLNTGWGTREEAIKQGAQFIRKTYGKGEQSIDNHEYGFNVISAKNSDGTTSYKWGTIYRGPKKDGDRASTGLFDQDFHTHTRQSPQTRDDLRSRWGGLKSSRDYVLPSWPGDLQSVGIGSGSIYIGNSDSFRRGVIWKFTLQKINGIVSQVSDEIKLQ